MAGFPLYGEPSRGATLGFIAPQGFFSFFIISNRTLVEREKVTKVTQIRVWDYVDME